MQVQKLAFALALLIAFTAYTLVVGARHSPIELNDSLRAGGWSLQVFLDLVLATFGFYVLASADSKRHGISHWPYFIAAIFIGSIAMLAYFVHRQLEALRRPSSVSPVAG